MQRDEIRVALHDVLKDMDDKKANQLVYEVRLICMQFDSDVRVAYEAGYEHGYEYGYNKAFIKGSDTGIEIQKRRHAAEVENAKRILTPYCDYAYGD